MQDLYELRGSVGTQECSLVPMHLVGVSPPILVRSGVPSLGVGFVYFFNSFILSMGSRKAVLSVPRTLDMVPLGEILQDRSNQGVKAYSDNSDR